MTIGASFRSDRSFRLGGGDRLLDFGSGKPLFDPSDLIPDRFSVDLTRRRLSPHSHGHCPSGTPSSRARVVFFDFDNYRF